ncbi:MAG: metallophosphoesterase, partial [Mariniphaga sp.]|nr:metallophosphoesterase [Mariniphaga sp.]
MKKVLATLIAVLFSNLLIGQTGYFEKEPYLFFKNKVNPITGEVTPEIGKIVIQWQLNVFMNDPCELKYGLEPNSGPIVTANYLTDDLWYVELDFDDDLEYDEFYYYQAFVMDDGIPIDSKQGSFRTPPLNNASSVVFYGYGDTRTYPAVHDQVCSSIINSLDGSGQDQTLLIHTGDWTSNDEENDWENEYFNTAFPYSLEVKSKFQIMGALGNHEHYGTTFKKYWPYSYYDQSTLGFHYSFDYGPIHFCIVDLPNHIVNCTLTQAQKNWIENDLDASPADWKVMVFHAPGYSSGVHPNNAEAQNYLHPLCSDKGVQLVLNGHNHNYAHWYLNRVHHLTLGGGGATLYNPTNTSGPGYVYSQKVHHFAKFTINGDIMKVNVIDKEGDEVESFAVPKTFTICNNTNALWNEDIVLADNVIVCSGSTLTITSMVSFTEYAKIIVKPGGLLILDGALLTSSGNYMWQGIEVRGNPTSSNPLDQGRLTMKNGAVIENAIVAVRNHRYNEDVTPKYSEYGGIIGATNSTFRNNIKAVDARDYQYTSMVSFSDCDFIYDEDYFGTGDPGYFMEIRSMKGVNVTSCNFINNTGVDNKGSGIYSYRSQVDVKGKCISPSQPCSEWEDGTFENLLYGIYATDISGGHYIDIRNTTFDLCHRGLYISGMTNARITSNQFNTNAHYKPLPLGGYGMYLNNSTGYWVEDNDYYHEGPTQ